MSTIADKLNLLKNTKENIRLAINEKGVACGTDVSFSSYPSKIMQIEGGGGGSSILSTSMLKLNKLNVDKGVVLKSGVYRYIYYKSNVDINVNVKRGVTKLSLSVTEG